MDNPLILQGREAASRLVHTQDVTGSSPVPATSFSTIPPEREGGQVRLARLPVPAGDGGYPAAVKDHRSAARNDRRAGRACHRAPFRCRYGLIRPRGPP